MNRAGERDLHRRCAAAVRRLDRAVGIPAPFRLDTFLERWSARPGGRAVELMPLTPAEMPAATCGLLVRLPDLDVVGFPAGAAGVHRDHIVLHEIGHLLCGHRGAPGGATIAALLPDLDPAMVRAVLGRSVYDDVQEREAELVASLILQRTLRTEPARSPMGTVGERLQRALDD